MKHHGQWLLSRTWVIGVQGGGGGGVLISQPRPAPPKAWCLKAGPFFPTSNWKNWPPSLARSWEDEQGGIEPGGALQWLLCPCSLGAGVISVEDNSQKAVTPAGPDPRRDFPEPQSFSCLSSPRGPRSLPPSVPHLTRWARAQRPPDPEVPQ